MSEVIKVEDCGNNIGDYDIKIHNAIIIPKNATNGDMLKALFPQWDLREEIGYGYKLFGEKHKFEGLVDESWWKAPYKESER